MIQSARQDVRLLLGDLWSTHRGPVARAGLLSFAAALAEGFGILTLVPVLAFATAARAPVDLPFVDALFAAVPAQSRLAAALAAFVGLMGLRALLIFARDRARIGLDAAYQTRLRLRTAATLAARGWRHAAAIGQTGMQSLLHNEVPRSTMAVAFVIQLLVASLMILVQAALAAVLSWQMTLVALMLAAVGAPLGWWFIRRAQLSGRAIAASLDESSRSGMQLHAELKAAMAQDSAGRFLQRYRESLGRLASELRRFGRDQALATALFGLLAAILAACLVWAAIRVAGLSLPVSIGLLLLFARMNGPAQQLFQASSNLAAYASSFRTLVERLGPLIDAPAGADADRPPLDWQRLELRDVSLELDQPILREVSLTLERGEWLAIEGASGAGKTSLIDLIAGLFAPSAGEVLVDGAALEGDRLARWQRSIAYVGQDEMIFDASLRDNLLAGVGPVAQEKFDQALALSGLDRLVAGWPEGLDLPLFDRGSRLSGGERQRVGIARAMLRGASLIILDEATSALDPAAEAHVLEGIRALEPRPAALLVSHRAATLAHADRQVTLKKGSVAFQPRFTSAGVERQRG